MQIKTTMKYYLTLVGMAIIKSLQAINTGEGVEKKESSYPVGEKVNWNSHYAERYGGYLRKLKTDFPQDQ